MDPTTPTVTPPDGFSLKAFARPERGDLAIWYYRVFSATGDVARGQLTFVPVKNPGEALPPAMAISYDLALMLANSLWDAGIRPVQSSGSVGQVQAMQAHIDDLREQNAHLRTLLSERPAAAVLEAKEAPAHLPKILNFAGVGSSAPIRCLCCGGRDVYDNPAAWPAGEVACECNRRSRQLARVPVPAAPNSAAQPG